MDSGKDASLLLSKSNLCRALQFPIVFGKDAISHLLKVMLCKLVNFPIVSGSDVSLLLNIIKESVFKETSLLPIVMLMMWNVLYDM
jgi:hypothetical protein